MSYNKDDYLNARFWNDELPEKLPGTPQVVEDILEDILQGFDFSRYSY